MVKHPQPPSRATTAFAFEAIIRLRMRQYRAVLARLGVLLAVLPLGSVSSVAAAAETTDPSDTTPVSAATDLPAPAGKSPAINAGESAEPSVIAPVEAEPADLQILDSIVAPGELRRLAWRTGFGYGLTEEPVPVLVAHGQKSGPTLCMTSAVHGDELNGIEIVRRVMAAVDPKELRGTMIGVPIVNVHGFERRSRYLPDRRDLNRHFPGDPEGSLASRVAYSFFTQIVSRCDVLVDLHTGSFQRTNLPQLRADLRLPEVVEFSRHFGAITVLHSPAASGTLRGAATDAGMPAVTFEVGEPNRLQAGSVAQAVTALRDLQAGLGMYGDLRKRNGAQPVFYESAWVRADRGGILFTTVQLGQSVRAGEVLGTVTDPLSNVYAEITAPFAGRVLGKAVNQFVMPGFAAFRIGVETDEERVAEEPADEAASETPQDDQPPS